MTAACCSNRHLSHVQSLRHAGLGHRAFIPVLHHLQDRRTISLTSSWRDRGFTVLSSTVAPGCTVLVAGATGGVGQLLTAKLLERGYTVKALCRSVEKARTVLSGMENIEVVTADLRNPDSLNGIFTDVDAVVCCTGTTAFPSNRWKDNNGPEQTDYHSVRHLVAATPNTVKRFVLTTSAGVERSNQIPFSILNIFGVLKWKREGEKLLEASGLPYTILRPGRLTDGPYTSYDLNTLLQATSGSRQDVQLSAKDDLLGEASRIAVAEAIVQALSSPKSVNQLISLASKEGDGPGTDQEKWDNLFSSLIN